MIQIPGVDYSYDPRQHFPDFYQNSVIKDLAEKPHWSMSTNKKPIDMSSLGRPRKEFHLAESGEPPFTMTLTESIQILPTCTNHAYFLDVLRDGYFCIDIESDCPEEIKQFFLQSDYTYGEISMSGNGLHLFYPIQDWFFEEYPIAREKTVMKEEHKWYEVLLNHWVTFTRNTIPPGPCITSIHTRLRELGAKQTISAKSSFDLKLEKPDIPLETQLMSTLMYTSVKVTPEKYHHDMSRYEFGYAYSICRSLSRILQNEAIQKKNHAYSPAERAWLIYQTIKERLTYRPKHDEARDNLPWLLYVSRNVVAQYDENKKQEELQKETEEKHDS